MKLGLERLDTAANDPSVGLELGFAGAPEPDTAADTREVGPHPGEAGQQVLELGQLDLELGLVTAGAGGEDVEDDFRPVHHADLELALEVGALRRRQLLVEDHERGAGVGHRLGNLLDLALADEGGGIGCRDLLRHAPDDFGPGRVHQPGELFQVFGDVPGVGTALPRGGDEHRALDRIPDLDRCLADRPSFLVSGCRGSRSRCRCG